MQTVREMFLHLVLLCPFTGQATTLNPDQLEATYGKLPLHFEANRGQTDASVKFLARGPGYSLFLTPTETVMSLRKPESNEVKPLLHDREGGSEAGKITALRMQLLGANPTPNVMGIEELPGKVNYFIGKDESQWRTDISTYAKVKYQAVYPGIDLVFYGNQRQLEYDFIVAPGADPKAVHFGFTGLDESLKSEPRIDSNGDLVVSFEGGEVRWHKPLIYQEKSGQRKTVDGKFVLDKGQVGFQVAAYDKTQPLVIDPVLVYSTYLGGKGSDGGQILRQGSTVVDGVTVVQGITADKFGNAYITGLTTSTNFPTKRPLQNRRGDLGGDVYVAKINKNGTSLVYSTYLGGNLGDWGNSIAADASGNVYITGQTSSIDFPTKNPIQPKGGDGRGIPDAFVSKINSSGSALIYSTYLGGTGGFDVGNDIVVDSQGQAYVVGTTDSFSFNFPTKNPLKPIRGGQDAFVAKINKSGSDFIYSTFLGGTSGEKGLGIDIDKTGNAYVTGQTYSDNYPTKNPFQKTKGKLNDAFVTKINVTGSDIIYSTFLGGKLGVSMESGNDIAVDTKGQAYVTGYTCSADFPTKKPLIKLPVRRSSCVAFISEFNKQGSGLIYSTLLDVGRLNLLGGVGIAVDGFGNAYVTGTTDNSTTGSVIFPIKNAFQKKNGGFNDAFVIKIKSGGSVLGYSSYIGGNGNEAGLGIAVDPLGNAYVTGGTNSTNFPTKLPLQKTLSAGGDDAFIVKISK